MIFTFFQKEISLIRRVYDVLVFVYFFIFTLIAAFNGFHTVIVLSIWVSLLCLTPFMSTSSRMWFFNGFNILVIISTAMIWAPVHMSYSNLIFPTIIFSLTAIMVGSWNYQQLSLFKKREKAFGEREQMLKEENQNLNIQNENLEQEETTLKNRLKSLRQKVENLERQNLAFRMKEKQLLEQSEELENSKQEIEFLLNTISIMVTYKDCNNRIVKVNQAQANFMGLESPDELINYDLNEKLPPEEASKYREEDLSIIQKDEPVIGVTDSFTAMDGSVRHIKTDKWPYKDKKGNTKGVVVLGLDVTDLINAKGELAEQAQELKQSNEELEAFAYAISHDLKEPLRMIISFMNLLQKRHSESLDEEAHEFIHFAVDGAGRMTQMIQDLLNFSRIGRLKNARLEIVDPNRSIESAMLNLRVLAEEKQADIQISDLPHIRGNKHEIMALFQNLIGNALKYSKEGIPPIIRISCEEEDTQYKFSVSDNGIGIPQKRKDHIFTIFQRAHKELGHEGTGIGLAICKKIVNRMGGTIQVSSVEGEGSCFYFTIPKNSIND